jgi:hypothetical protein
MQVPIPILSGPASLGTRTLEVSVSPSPGAPQGQSEFIVITHGTDTTPPYIVNSQALTKGGKVVAFSLQFSKPMAIGPVTNLANYAIGTPSSPKQLLFYLGSSGGAFPKTIPLTSAMYDAASNTVYLVPATRVKPSRYFEIEPAFVNQANVRAMNASPNNMPASPAGFSNLVDTSGNPIASFPPANLLSTDGNFSTYPQVAKASPAVLSYLFGPAASARPEARLKSAHTGK